MCSTSPVECPASLDGPSGDVQTVSRTSEVGPVLFIYLFIFVRLQVPLFIE